MNIFFALEIITCHKSIGAKIDTLKVNDYKDNLSDEVLTPGISDFSSSFLDFFPFLGGGVFSSSCSLSSASSSDSDSTLRF